MYSPLATYLPVGYALTVDRISTVVHTFTIVDITQAITRTAGRFPVLLNDSGIFLSEKVFLLEKSFPALRTILVLDSWPGL